MFPVLDLIHFDPDRIMDMTIPSRPCLPLSYQTDLFPLLLSTVKENLQIQLDGFQPGNIT